MDIETANAILSRIEYKPGHKLVWERVTDDIIRIYWRFDRPDCYDPDTWGVGKSGPTIIYLPDMDEESLVRTTFGMTMRLEEHEAREWFLYDGTRPFDPHTKLVRRAVV